MSAAAPDTWMPLWIGPYLANTLHLNRAQHGSYCLLIMACWKAGGRLPANDATLATIARCTPREWKAERPVFAAFFTEEDGHWVHDRVVTELEKARGFVEQRAAAGRASAEARKRQRDGNDRSTSVATDGQREAKTTPTPSPSTVTTTLTVTTSAADAARQSGAAPRAKLIWDDWTPSEQAIANLRKGRPDLIGALYDERMQDFREWCRAKAVTSHDIEATWSSFMRRTKVPAEPSRKPWDKPQSTGLPPLEPWEKRLRDFRATGFWVAEAWGPKPGERGCRVPADLLRSAA